ncbi:hypothetical protein [Bartonella vinsonii]|uniref:Surface protein/Bartonella adhesin n=1 Tax=Bartonella vinsonii subsp. berkhoffii str. Tweed TaxID=1094502 RepID=N6UT32_BARVB|nr:surface protein/Bartonella adhesin [Bartonella vinsonii subsp. berkhoffii str. Tweed]
MKKYSTQNLVKAVSLGAVIATLLSSVSPILAANFAITGSKVESTNETGVSYLKGSHGSMVFAGDDDSCGVDNAVGRDGSAQGTDKQITVEAQYSRLINDQAFSSDGYMGELTDGNSNVMPEAYGVYSFATGCGASATGNYSAALSAGATTKAGIAQALRVSALSTRAAGVTMGEGSVASGESAIAIGKNAKASGKKSIAIGESSKATQNDAIAIGSHTEGNEANSVAIGNIASASGYNSVAIGLKTKASKEYMVAIGSKAEAQALGSIAIGGGEPADNGQERKVIAKGKNSIAIGSHTYANEAHSVAVGINAQVLVTDGVAVGGGSVSRVNKDTFGYDPATNATTKKGDLAWKSTGGDFSIGNTNQNLTRQITNVAAGTQDTDAVNVAQLKAMRDVIAGVWKLSVNDGDSTAINAGNIVDFSVKNDNQAVKDNLKITKDNGNNIKFTLSDELNLTSVTTGESIMDASGFRFIGDDGPSITVNGIHAGDKTIKGVAEGTDDTDAVNYAQLKEIGNKIAGGGLVKWDEGGKLITIGAEKDGTIIDVANKLDVARAITGVAKGNISNVSTDVINGEQIHSIGNEIAKIFGGKVSFDVGVFTGPKYNLTTIDEDGVVSQQEYNDVG